MTPNETPHQSPNDPDTRWTTAIVLIDVNRVVIIDRARTIITATASLLHTEDRVEAVGPLVYIHTSDCLRVGKMITDTHQARAWSRTRVWDAWRPSAAEHQHGGPVVTACVDGIQLILGEPAAVLRLCEALNSTGDFAIDINDVADTASASIDKFPEHQHDIMVRAIVRMGRSIDIPVVDAREPKMPAL